MLKDMNRQQLERLSKEQLIDIILWKPRQELQTRFIEAPRDNIIPPPPEFRDPANVTDE